MKCNHVNCNCDISEDEKYCADSCRQAAEFVPTQATNLVALEDKCACGHKDCPVPE